MYKQSIRNKNRVKRHIRQVKHLKGTAERPRLSVFRSLRHLYVQVIDDNSGHTLLGVNTLSSKFKERSESPGNNFGNAVILGKWIAELCLEKDIQKVVFDRNGQKFHGRIKAIADAAREAGLNI